MSKYDRIEPSRAIEPTPRMRIYGRSAEGVIGLVVVHEVSGGQVYFARRRRHEKPGLYRSTCDVWRSNIRDTLAAGLIIGIQVPKTEIPIHD